MRSTFGMEHKRIGPRGEIAGLSYGFGKGSSRDQARHASISKERSIEFHGRESSTFYLLPPSTGAKQPDGQKLDAPQWKFGTVPRNPRYNSGTAGGAASTRLATRALSSIIEPLPTAVPRRTSMRSQAFTSSSLPAIRKSFSTLDLQSWQLTHLV